MPRRIFYALIMLPVLFSVSTAEAEAQGWSFTMTINYSGPCGSYRPQLPIFTIPFMPNQGTCESIRAQLMAITGSVPSYDNYGNYIGDCTASVVCTACTGSDAASASISDPGNVSINGLVQGNAFFSPHQSMSVENWIEETQQKLRSMGYEVDAEKTVRAQDIPLTGNDDFDKYYTGQMVRFEKPEQGGTVYLKEGTKGIIDPNDLKNKGKTSENETKANSSGKETANPGSVVPLPGSVPEYAGTYNFTEITSAGKGIAGNDPPGASFAEKSLEIITGAAKSKYSEWVGLLAQETCSNITEAANILGSSDVNSVSGRDMTRFDEKAVLLKTNVDFVKNEVTEGIIGTITGTAVKAVEFVGEKTSIKICPAVSSEVVKNDYNTGLSAGKYILEKSSVAKKGWGLFN